MNIPAWQPMSELPEDDDQAIQVKLEFEGREMISVLTFAADWRTRAILKIAEGYHEITPFKATAWRPMNEDLWRCAPNTPESVAAQEAEAAERYKNSAEYKLARLEDLRRWRPMSEYPADDRHVLVSVFEPGEEPAIPDTARWKGAWLCADDDYEEPIDEAKLIAAHCRWTYIPGQEPKEEL